MASCGAVTETFDTPTGGDQGGQCFCPDGELWRVRHLVAEVTGKERGAKDGHGGDKRGA